MKRSKFQLVLLIVTFTCLIFLVGIQVSWILTSAKMQEAQFNHSVSMAMNRIVDNLSRDREICREVSNCLREGTSGSCYLLMKNKAEWENIGVMIKEDLKYYGITLNFEFDIVDKQENTAKVSSNNVYFTNDLENVLEQSGYELKLKFPEKRDFIKAQIGYIFIASMVLLILVSFSFLLIFRYYKREKRLTENIVDIINNMTHEFRTPLTNIALANSMISKNEFVEKDEKLSSYSRVISSEQKRLKDRVDELLKTSFSETKKESAGELVNVSSALEEVIATFEVQAKVKSGKIELEKPVSDLFITASNDSFRIAAGNLIDNSLKYSSGNPEIIIRLSQKNNIVTIEISDNGPGIAREHQSQIFTKYFRVPTGDVYNSDGFGLGLYYVKNTVISAGGRIKLTSTPGKGAKFTLEFPQTIPA
jgi:two-component system, OmpR family, phosphate regulon sensor histidine kinase PhoR